MRIISGKFKGRKLEDSSKLDLRPTTDMNREALFNILASGKFIKEIGFTLQDANIVDVCCGTGAVGFEALSRGAKSAIFIDINPQHLEIAKKNADNFELITEVQFIIADVKNLRAAQAEFELVYIDPPYSDNAAKMMQDLLEKKWITKKSLVVVESAQINFADVPMKLLEQRKYGRTYFSFFVL